MFDDLDVNELSQDLVNFLKSKGLYQEFLEYYGYDEDKIEETLEV